ncbi:MAG: peptide chain release factor N(5)-glutamine methyltransferase [Gemmatimonas sp.]
MTLREVLTRVVARIAEAPALEREVRDDAAREGRLLAAGVLALSPGGLAQRLVGEPAIRAGEAEAIEVALHRRLRGEPLAYAVGSAPFRELVLQVDRRVLIPRPETEVVVDEALRLTAARPGGVAVDIGTGSGAIALALATEGRFDEVIATDVSADALEVAEANGRLLLAHTHAPVRFRLGADLAPLAGVRARVIVSNPPYIAYEEAGALPRSVRDWEPPVALFAADRGMARYQALLAGAQEQLEPGGVLVLELDAQRAAETAQRAVRYGFVDVQVVQDYSGRDRVLTARAPAA